VLAAKVKKKEKKKEMRREKMEMRKGALDGLGVSIFDH
jgi:hypothetical protein